MKRYRNKIHLLHIYLGMLVLVFILGVSLDKRSSSSSSNDQGDMIQTTIMPPRIVNKTNGFEIVSVERNGLNVRLTLKNNYSKSITAYALSVGGIQTKYELAVEQTINPGGVREESLNLQPERQEDEINLLAVMFKDKTGDGDDKIITEIKDLRLGKRIQFRRIIPHLQVLLNTPDDQLESAIQEMRNVINNLPVGSAQESSYFFIVGLRNARESMLIDLKGLEQSRQLHGNDIFRRGLIKNKERLSQVIEKF